MRKSFLTLVAVYMGFVTYCLLVFFFGKSGVFELQNAIEYRDRLTSNNTELREIGNELSKEAQILVSDPETIALRARELGYLRENQGRIYFYGYSSKEQSYALGKILKWTGAPKDRSSFFRTLSIGLSIVSAALVFLVIRKPTRRKQ